MFIAEFDYDLPEGAVAQTPVEPRDRARLFVDRGAGRPADHMTVADLADQLHDGDVLVVNDTRVISARLALRKSTGGAAEVFLLEPVGDGSWQALIRPARRLQPGTRLTSDDGNVVVVVGDRVEGGRSLVHIEVGGAAIADAAQAVALDGIGQTPLPPYITAELTDPSRYQTVFADRPGSVAAPTPGAASPVARPTTIARAAWATARAI